MIRLLRDLVLILVDKPLSVSASGLYVATNVNDAVTRGTVVATGPGKYNYDTETFDLMPCKEDDYVVFVRSSGRTVKVGKYEMVIVEAKEILCVLKKEEDVGSSGNP